MRDGIDDESYQNTFVPIVSKVMESYQPSAVVLQCGADSLSGDRLGCFKLTLKGMLISALLHFGTSLVSITKVPTNIFEL